jgi:hypothetical protein
MKLNGPCGCWERAVGIHLEQIFEAVPLQSALDREINRFQHEMSFCSRSHESMLRCLGYTPQNLSPAWVEVGRSQYRSSMIRSGRTMESMFSNDEVKITLLPFWTALRVVQWTMRYGRCHLCGVIFSSQRQQGGLVPRLRRLLCMPVGGDQAL